MKTYNLLKDSVKGRAFTAFMAAKNANSIALADAFGNVGALEEEDFVIMKMTSSTSRTVVFETTKNGIRRFYPIPVKLLCLSENFESFQAKLNSFVWIAARCGREAAFDSLD